jgi:1,4-dihydroxy-2-naphthoate octaprenyltransferase
MTALFKLARPLHLLLAALTYFLGASIANYLGKTFRADAFWFGFAGILLAQLTMSLLSEVFRLDAEPLLEGEIRRQRQILRNNALYVSIAALASVAFIAFILYFSRTLTLLSFFFLFISLSLIVAYSLPPFRGRGFGEFILSVHLAYVIPSIAYLLQAGTAHRFLILTVPLTFLAFAYLIVLDFPAFATDRKYNRVSFLTRLGWERVVPLHHLFVLLAYILLAISPAFGIALSLIWPSFLTFPFALFQIHLLRNISLGAPPNWTLLTATALSVFGLTAYFLALTFWLR